MKKPGIRACDRGKPVSRRASAGIVATIFSIIALAFSGGVCLAKEPSALATIDQENRAHAMLLALLSAQDPASVRDATAALQKSPPTKRDELIALAEAVKSSLASTRDAALERELRLALGTLAAAGVEDAAEWGFESMSVTHRRTTHPEVFDAHVRALEMVPGAAKELMIGNLDVAINLPEADPKERQRLKEFVTLTAEKMRTRELADFLDALLTGEDDLFVKIEAPLEARLIACYRNVKSDPPINTDALVKWLEKHPGGPPEIEIAALEVISTVGTTKKDFTSTLTERLLAQRTSAIQIGQRLAEGKIDRSLLPQVRAALEKHASMQPSDDIQRLLSKLK
jgi:hypothetical protein